MSKKYTAIIRKSQLEYLALCLDLNLAARGETLAEVEKNLRSAIKLYLEDVALHPETIVTSTSSEALIEFFRDTEPQWYQEPAENYILKPLEIHEVPAYSQPGQARTKKNILVSELKALSPSIDGLNSENFHF